MNDETFRLLDHPTPDTLAIAIQSAHERSGALGIDVTILDVAGRVVYVAKSEGEN